jgi:hypothetical protein
VGGTRIVDRSLNPNGELLRVVRLKIYGVGTYLHKKFAQEDGLIALESGDIREKTGRPRGIDVVT